MAEKPARATRRDTAATGLATTAALDAGAAAAVALALEAEAELEARQHTHAPSAWSLAGRIQRMQTAVNR